MIIKRSLYQGIGKFIQARKYFEKALAIQEKRPGSNPFETAATLNNIGVLLDKLEDFTQAADYYKRALQLLEAHFPPDYSYTHTIRENLSKFQLERESQSQTDRKKDYFIQQPSTRPQKSKTIKHPQPGRNDPCWCGSGKKYKHCHLQSDQKN
jgi:tetratricopeptide (TPR) repeat protein